MIRLLIVDDEPEMLAILKSQLDWQRLSIFEVFTASSYRQALDVCSRTVIHIMICDIEMPQHSGLELMDEVNARYGNVVVIFLTGYDSFAYCKRALELGGLEYLLKPVQFDELEKAILRAVDKVQEQSKISRFTSFEEDISAASPADSNLFWLNVFNGLILPHEDIFLSAAKRYHVIIDKNEHYSILLLHTLPEEIEDDGIERKEQLKSLFCYLSKSISYTVVCALTLLDHYLAFVLYSRSLSDSELVQTSDLLIAYVNEVLNKHVDIIVSGFVYPWTIPKQIENQLWLFRNTFSTHNSTYLLKSQQIVQKLMPIPPEEWKQYLSIGHYSYLSEEINKYLNRQMPKHGWRISKEALAHFIYEFVNMIQFYLTSMNFASDWVTEENLNYLRAFRTIPNCQTYTAIVLKRLSETISDAVSRNDIVQSAKQYIETHIYDDISRNDIAVEIGVNAEYLSRLFKNRMKVTLVEYIARKKMKVATLLLSSNMTVSEVAVRLGYTNFAYFTQLFKKHTKTTPTRFKKQLMNRD